MISANQQKYIASLHLKKFRQKYLKFLVEGEKLVKELLTQSAIDVEVIYGTERWASENAALLAPSLNMFNTVTEVELKKIGTLTTPNQVLAVAHLPRYEKLQPAAGALSLYLDGLQDPGNMGTILRIADWFGLEAVYCSPDTVDAFSPKVIQSGMGACFRVRVVEDITLDQLAHLNKDQPIMGAVMNGDNIFAAEFPSEGILVIGNEGRGIRVETEQMLTHRLTIPGAERAESLNAAVATGILVAQLVHANKG